MRRVLALAVFVFVVPSVTAAQTIQPSPTIQATSPQSAPPSGSKESTGTGIIRGRVFAADTGQPLRRAQVQLSGSNPSTVISGGLVMSDARQNRSATTDNDGKFEFKDLPPGRYGVAASKTSYVSFSFGQQRPGESGTPIDLLDAQVLERVDIGLPRGGVITGRVLDEYGEPMSNILVAAMRPEMVNGQRAIVSAGRTVSTDDLGEFRIFGVTPGQYYVQGSWRSSPMAPPPGARAADETGYATTFFPGTVDSSSAQRLTVGAGKTIGDVVFAMLPVKTARISGTAVDSRGQPLRGMLMIMRDSASGVMMSSGVPIRPDGSFTLANITPGDYLLRAQSTGGPSSDGRAAIPETGIMKLTVASADVSDVHLITSPPSTGAGRLIVDPAAAQAAAFGTMSIVASPMQPGTFMGSALPGRVNDDFTFALKAAPGLARINVMGQPPGFAIRAVRVAGLDVTDSGLEFKPGQDVNGIEIELTNQLTMVSGLVSNARSETAKDYTTIVFAQDESRWKVGSRYLRTTRPDQDGRFKIQGLPPGDYYAIALDQLENGSSNDPEMLRAVVPQATMFSLSEGETKTLDLKLKTKTP